MIDTIIGHSKQIEYFKNALENNNLSHAYLFDGGNGIGKKTLAYAIIRSILCGEKKHQDLFDAGNFSDFLEISPESNEIKTEEVKLIHEFLSTAPRYASKKVVLIDGAEKMNLHAQNKILKIIEEPPKYALFFLITSHKDKIVDTLISRLIRISFNAMSLDEIEEFTKKNSLDFDRETAVMANGSIGSYLALSEKDSGGAYNLCFDLIEAIKKKNKIKIFEIVKKMDDYKDNLHEILDALEFSYRDFLDIEGQDIQRIAHYLQHIGESRYRLNRNVQKDIIITSLVYGLEGVFK